MTLLLSESDYDELCQVSVGLEHHPATPVDSFETSRWLPARLGHGRTCCLELSPGVWLDLIKKEFTQPWALKVPVHKHLVQFTILLSGTVDYGETYPILETKRGYFSGSGLSPGYVARYGQLSRFEGINVHLEPEIFEQFLVGQSPFAQIP
jgi:hypothetical protein